MKKTEEISRERGPRPPGIDRGDSYGSPKGDLDPTLCPFESLYGVYGFLGCMDFSPNRACSWGPSLALLELVALASLSAPWSWLPVASRLWLPSRVAFGQTAVASRGFPCLPICGSRLAPLSAKLRWLPVASHV